jgi:spore coat protein U-like protein
MRAVLACGLVLISKPALAVLQGCTVSATSVTFASAYDPSNVNGLDGTGTITVSCSVLALGLFENWDILLDPGINSAGSYTPRKLNDGFNHKMTYNLYTNLGHSSVWGDGATSGTLKVSDQRTLQIGNSQYPYTVYAHLDALQDLPPGTYGDTITVTLNYN